MWSDSPGPYSSQDPILCNLSDTGSIVSKSGHSNVASISVPDRIGRYLDDIYTTLVDIKWRWNLLIFFGVFTFSWLGFAAFYIMLSSVNGDLDDEHPDNWKPCVTNIRSFASAFLFSIETMTTIGYGYRYVTEACPGAYLGVLVQSIIGAALQIALSGLVVAKIRRSKKRTNTILFSDVACIFSDDNKMKLAIRVGDMRKSDITAAHVRGFLLQKLKSKKHGKSIPVSYFSITLRSEGGSEQLFLPWPIFVVHDIDENSPLWEISKDDLMMENFELIVMLEGIDSSTSLSFQAKKAYKPSDIQWGRRFHGLGIVTDDDGENFIRFELFHATFPISTPSCSAKETDERLSESNSSPEIIRKRKTSRTDSVSSVFCRRKSISDTFLGPEFEDFDDSRSHSLLETERQRKTSRTESVSSILQTSRSITNNLLAPGGSRSPSLIQTDRVRKTSRTESVSSILKSRKYFNNLPGSEFENFDGSVSPSLLQTDRRRKTSKTETISSILKSPRHNTNTLFVPGSGDLGGSRSPSLHQRDKERSGILKRPRSVSDYDGNTPFEVCNNLLVPEFGVLGGSRLPSLQQADRKSEKESNNRILKRPRSESDIWPLAEDFDDDTLFEDSNTGDLRGSRSSSVLETHRERKTSNTESINGILKRPSSESYTSCSPAKDFDGDKSFDAENYI
ncbi:ATP-sensitive inward rectifier potassium channel 12-like [Patella vulgata]|uniref:ATP-sensitive inward rectifier potassium channel 12-like n=1 Tax=Patella vulgata TaxID=6465 RepID=UPI0021802987|nr:ATP-sensitive inward rectifier potassium channel 12-like [Patella vulgata]